MDQCSNGLIPDPFHVRYLSVMSAHCVSPDRSRRRPLDRHRPQSMVNWRKKGNPAPDGRPAARRSSWDCPIRRSGARRGRRRRNDIRHRPDAESRCTGLSGPGKGTLMPRPRKQPPSELTNVTGVLHRQLDSALVPPVPTLRVLTACRRDRPAALLGENSPTPRAPKPSSDVEARGQGGMKGGARQGAGR
jgi:hypothetical protein